MASLPEIEAALRKADAAGNVEDARRLAAAYREMRGQPAGPPQSAKPGSREYADWAAAQARSGAALPQVSEAPPEWKDPLSSDIGAKAQAMSSAWLNDIPVAGPAILDTAQKAKAALWNLPLETIQADTQRAMDANPVESKAAGITSSIASLAPLGMTQVGGRLLGMSGNLASRVGFGAGSGALLSGADTAARGGDAGQIATSGLLGLGLGAALPAVGAAFSGATHKAAQHAATTAAIKGAPDATDLKSAGTAMFQQLDQSGVQVSGQRLGDMATELVQKFVKLRANPNLDPKATGALQEVVRAINDTQKAGGGLALSDLHTLRQIAQAAARSSEGRDQMFSNQIIKSLDDMIGNLKPADIIGGADPSQAAKLMYDAIGTWGRSRRVGLIEEAIYNARNQASGFENGLRAQFRSLLRNPDTRKLFTEAERQEIERVVRGTTGANILKLIGKFGFGGGNAGNMLGGSVGTAFGAAAMAPLGPFGSAIGAAIAGGGASLARKASEAVTTKAAERAAKVVATPNVPSLPRLALPDARIAPALLPLILSSP